MRKITRKRKKKINRYKTNTAKGRRKNKLLCDRYPFLIPVSAWDGKPYWDKKYAFTLADDFPVGWWKAFGLMLCEDLRVELSKYHYLDKFRITDIKEKYGQLRIYHNGAPIGCEVNDIIGDYSILSENICIRCGRPDSHMTNEGWIMPECYECYKKKYVARCKYSKKKIPSEQDILDAYKNCCVDDGKMQESYKIIKYSKEGSKHIEISTKEKADRIRSQWRGQM